MNHKKTNTNNGGKRHSRERSHRMKRSFYTGKFNFVELMNSIQFSLQQRKNGMTEIIWSFFFLFEQKDTTEKR